MSSPDQETLRKFNQIFRKVTRQEHPLRYWQAKGDFFSFGYTPHRQPDDKFHAMKFRSNKEVKRLVFSRRNTARNRAYHWYCERKAALEKMKAAKPVKPAPTKLEILQKKLAKLEENTKGLKTKRKRLETLIKKRQKVHERLWKQICNIHSQEALAELDQAKRDEEAREDLGEEP